MSLDPQIFDQCDIGLIVCDHEGVVSFSNSVSARLLGLDSELAVSAGRLWDLNPAFNREVIEHRLESRTACERLIRRTNESIPDNVVARISKSSGSQGQVMVMLFELGSLSSLVASVDALEDSLRTSTLEAIGKISGKLGHDFNNLLGSLMGCVDLMNHKMKKIYPDGSPIDRQLQIMESSIQKSIGITTRMRGFVRPGPLETRRVEIGSCLDAVIDELHKSDTVPFDIELNIDSDLQVEIDQFPVVQMLMGICLNSIEAMENFDERHIVVHVREQIVDEESNLDCCAGIYAQVSIMDHGIGIKDENVALMSDPLYSSKKVGVGRGLGIGLSMAQELMKKHGGALDFHSSPGVGTVVSLYFPVVK